MTFSGYATNCNDESIKFTFDFNTLRMTYEGTVYYASTSHLQDALADGGLVQITFEKFLELDR